MPKIIVASQNPVKIDAVRQGFEQLFAGKYENGELGELEITGVSVPSGVPDQPMGQQQTLLGACTTELRPPVSNFQEQTTILASRAAWKR